MSEIDWPDHLERTPPRERTRNNSFEVSLAQALDDLEAELKRVGVDDHRISTGARQRKRDQRPYANANPDDPGFVLRWSKDGDQFAIAADAYSRLRDNVREVGLYVREKRKMEGRKVRTGEDEFANARLPPADDEDVLAVGPDGGSPAPHELLDVSPDAPDAVVEGAARAMIKRHHPDTKGGVDDPEMIQRVKQARDAMLGGENGV